MLHACTRTGKITAPPTPETYAALRRLPVDFLASPGLAIVRIAGSPTVKMPYSDGDGAAIGARLCVALEGKNRFKWRKRTRVQP